MKTQIISILIFFGGMGAARAQTQPPTTVDPALCGPISSGDLGGVIAAIGKGSDPNGICSHTYREDRTAFDVALTANTPSSEEIASFLISKGARADAINTFRGSWGRRRTYTNFDSACSHSLVATQAFLHSGVNVQTVDGSLPRSPLYSALNGAFAEKLKLEMSDLLIQYGQAPSDGRGASQLTFLLSSTFDDALVTGRIAQWHFDKDPIKVGEYLSFAASSHRGVPVLNELVLAGASVSNPSGDGRNALVFYLDSFAQRPSDAQTVDWLLKKGAHPDATSLIYAFYDGNLPIIELLVKSGVDLNVPLALASNDEYNSKTPLEAVGLLFRYGANANRLSQDGFSPLSTASMANHLEMAKIYVAHGAQVNFRNSDGTTPRCLAKQNGAVEVESYLRSKGGVLGNCPTN